MGKVIIHHHAKDASTASDFNGGLSRNVIARLREATLPSKPTDADVSKSKDMLSRAKNDIDGLIVVLRGIAPAKATDAAPCGCKNKAKDATFNAKVEYRGILSDASAMVRACKNVYLLAQQAGDQAAAADARKVWDAAEKMHSLIHQNA